MGYGRNIPDHRDRESLYLQRPKSGFSTNARSFHTNFRHTHPLFHGFFQRVPAGNLRRKRGAFPRTFYPSSTCTRLGNYITARIRNGDNGIIESGLDMNDPRRDIFFLPLGPTFLFLGSRHSISSFLYYFRLPTTALLGPFLVLALVLVRCPRTGNPRLCLKPL